MFWMAQSLRAYLSSLEALWQDFRFWATTMDDSTFMIIMVGGLVVLAFAIARALK
jgi:hypothetical protein